MTCTDGSVYSADHVIVTIPLGVLKERFSTMFTPSLPTAKINAINGLGFGTVGKVFMEFSLPFWPTTWSGFTLIWNKADAEVVAKSDNAWVLGLAGIWRVSYQPNILAGFIAGPYTRKMETLSDLQIQNSIMFVFQKFLSKTKLKPTIPKRILTSKWFSNKNFRGGYSYRSVKADQLKINPDVLAAPLNDCNKVPRILFAGEATNRHYFSSVHGAVETGYREADKLIDYYSD